MSDNAQTRARGLITALATVTATLGLGPAAAESFVVVSDYDTFAATFIGAKIGDPEDTANYFVIAEDGTLEGPWHGRTLKGEWRWEDGFFCRTLTAPPAPEDCQQWSVSGNEARLVRNRGTGETTVYTIRE